MNKDFVLWTVDDEEVVTSGLGPEVSAGTYVSFDYFMTIKNPNNEAFLQRFRTKFGKDALMNTVGVANYNAAHMAALAIKKAGKVTTEALRENLKDLSFDRAPQGKVTMRGRDNQMVLPTALDEGPAGLDRRRRHVRGGAAPRLGDAGRRALQEPAALRRGGLQETSALAPAGPERR